MPIFCTKNNLNKEPAPVTGVFSQKFAADSQMPVESHIFEQIQTPADIVTIGRRSQCEYFTAKIRFELGTGVRYTRTIVLVCQSVVAAWTPTGE